MSTLEITLLAYQVIISVVILGMFWVTLVNLLHIKKLPAEPQKPGLDTPRISVLIPARNEERCIEACITSLAEQEYTNFEVVVLDDGSTDDTPNILRRMLIKYPNLTVLKGSPLPTGWVGKPWACHQLAQQADGELLLFTDADTTHKPKTLSASVEVLNRYSLDFFSMIPFEVMGTFAENAVIPMVHMLFLSYIPNVLLHKTKQTSFAAANGQFMFFRRVAYEAIGGHTSVHDAIVEDVFLAKVLKAHGKRIGLLDGTSFVACRMYTSAREVTRGFSKNLFPGTGYNLPFTVVLLLHLFTAFIGPVLSLIAGLWLLQANPKQAASIPYALALFSLPVQQLAMAGIIRFLIAMRFKMPWWHALIQPLTAIWTIMIGINSIRWAYSNAGSQWKGRSYKRGIKKT